MTPNEVLKQAREKAGKSLVEVFEDLQFTAGEYCDMEQHDDELYTCVDLKDVLRLTRYFGLTVQDLFAIDRAAVHGRHLDGFESLAAELREHLRRSGVSLADFEDKAGWRLGDFLADPSTAWMDWNVDCLRDVARELAVDWLSVLAAVEDRRVG